MPRKPYLAQRLPARRHWGQYDGSSCDRYRTCQVCGEIHRGFLYWKTTPLIHNGKKGQH